MERGNHNGDPNDPNERPGKYEWDQYKERIQSCIDLLHTAIDLFEQHDEEDIQRYENMNFLLQKELDSCAWDYDYYNGVKHWYKHWCLSDEFMQVIKLQISSNEIAIMLIKKEQEKVDKYWSEHQEERAALETEKEALEEAIDQWKEEKSSLPELTTESQMIDRRRKEEEELSRLGLFKKKEKMVIRQRISEIDEKIEKLEDVIKEKISPIDKKIKKIRRVSMKLIRNSRHEKRISFTKRKQNILSISSCLYPEYPAIK